ncbi:MAG: phosphotriesterase, partial [Chloroflexi bacterium]|nr:phosphotriesterase [Chloroflexota bacterium]
MPQVETLRGPVDTADLGSTLMHEHVFILGQGVPENFPSVWDEEKETAYAREKLAELAGAGVSTIVDLTVMGLGRDIPRLRKVVGEIPVNVIVATGVYTYNELPQYFRNRDEDAMAELFVRDITEGIQGTEVKAAILKCATDEPGLTPDVEKVLRAVARAHRHTGAPISTHTHPGTKRGLEQQRVFKEEGVDLGRVVIGHSGDSEDLDYLQALIEAGSYIGMDRFGLDHLLPTDKRVAIIAKLCELGHADRMVLSHDANCYIDWFPMELIRNAMPNWHFRHISEDVLPALREAGVSDEQIKQMMVENPRR